MANFELGKDEMINITREWDKKKILGPGKFLRFCFIHARFMLIIWSFYNANFDLFIKLHLLNFTVISVRQLHWSWIGHTLMSESSIILLLLKPQQISNEEGKT